MGKEWYWSGSRSSTSKRGDNNNTTTSTTPSGCMSAVFHLFDFHHFQFPLNHHQHHHHQSPFISHHHEDHHHTVLKGVEAPRNSLELEETPSLSTSSNLKQEEEEEVENFKIPMGIQIKTNNNTRSSKSNYDSASSSEISSSSPGGSKTPNLVARLMGLDLLPDQTTNSSSFQEPLPTKLNLNHHHHHHHLRPTRQALLQPLQNKSIILHDVITTTSGSGTRSLPETPRISSARRSDVDYHHRLSLQINKENISSSGGEEVEFSRFSYLRRREIKEEEEYRSSSSPSQYAKQIVKQVKESVSRKVGLDITNTLKNRQILQSREEIFSQLKTKKSSSRALNKLVSENQSTSPGKHSSSPRLSRFLEPKQKLVTPPPTTATDLKIQAQPIRVNLSSKPKLQQQQQRSQSTSHDHRPAKKCKKAAAGEQRLIKRPPKTADVIRNKQEESFVRPSSTGNMRANNADKNYSKKTPLSNSTLLINISSVPSSTHLPVKKDPSPPATKIPQKQVLLNAQSSKRVSTSSSTQLSSNPSQISYKQQVATRTLVARDNNNINDRSNGGVATMTTTATTTTTTVGGAEHQEYIIRILKRTGLDKHTPVSFTTWFSPSHPLDPSIFHHLENNDNPTSDSGQLSLLCNRKLLFQLVDEILVDVLKPVINIKPWCNVIGSICRGCYYYGYMHGSDLIDTLSLVVGSFPCADCRVLEDIDGLIDKDLPKMKLQNEMAWEEEGEGVVMEIEKDILDSLIHETAFYFISILL
ncbi:hypothetical protein LWI29_036228 [Acer saccharum]|uniref:DUF4378 domain-containing protein n=1 Tax=Acer saccharum TaxID=4024 RepID=A0AA39SZT1_ACESA|nr:hypothetical protein LWI29_036228 [Acer saccharum]